MRSNLASLSAAASLLAGVAAGSAVQAQSVLPNVPGPIATDYGAVPSPQAEGGSRYRLGAGVDFLHDNNVFRGAAVPAGRNNSTAISHTYVRGNLDLPVSRQRFLAEVTASNNKFWDLSYLDYNAIDFRGSWLWAAGERLRGELKYDRLRSIADFIDSPPTVQRLRTLQLYGLTGEYALTPRWRLTGGYEGLIAETDDSTGTARLGNLEQRTISAGVKYAATGANYVRFLVRSSDGKYPNRTQTATLDDEYTQRDIGFDALYQLSDISNVTGQFFLTNRKYPDVSANDRTSVPTWRIDLNLAFSPISGFNVNTRQEFGVFEAGSSSGFLNRVVGVGPWWSFSPNVRGEFAYEMWEREYDNNARPKQELQFARLGLRWMPTRNWVTRAGYVWSKRESSVAGEAFTDRVLFGTVEYRF